jgi:SAM-dependent methyltransferase
MSPDAPQNVANVPPSRNPGARPWALEVFDHSLKKRLKLDLLLRLAGELDGRACLLVTCGDNPGALNWHFRAAGGRWSWAEMEADRIPAMEGLLEENLHHASPDRLPFPDESFDLVVLIDVHEHLDRVDALNDEIRRVLVPGGQAIVTTPSGDTRLPLARLKRRLGMTPEVYGHTVQGYTLGELEQMMRDVGLLPDDRGAYSRFFTEGIELALNFAYVKVLGRSPEGNDPPEGEIAPTSADKLDNVGGAWKLYRRVFPLLRGVSRLDGLLPGDGGYAVAVSARKPL